jgi:hypothetical protein
LQSTQKRNKQVCFSPDLLSDLLLSLLLFQICCSLCKFFLFPLLLFQVAGGMTKGLPVCGRYRVVVAAVVAVADGLAAVVYGALDVVFC